MIKVVAVDAPQQTRRLGALDGMFSNPDDFDTMFAEEIRQIFEGEED